MKFILTLLCLLVFAPVSYCQIEEPFIAGWSNETKIKSDSSGTYYRIGSKSIFYVNKKSNSYRIFDKEYHLLEEGEIGSYCIDCPARAGRCTAYYSDGKIKARGFYNHRGELIGTWQSFYPNAQLKELLTYDAANPDSRIGSYENYFQNGKSQCTGFYCITLKDSSSIDTVMAVDPRTGDIKMIVSKGRLGKPSSVRCGRWSYYNEQGDLIKQEDFE